MPPSCQAQEADRAIAEPEHLQSFSSSGPPVDRALTHRGGRRSGPQARSHDRDSCARARDRYKSRREADASCPDAPAAWAAD